MKRTAGRQPSMSVTIRFSRCQHVGLRLQSFILSVALISSLGAIASSPMLASDGVRFNEDIRPILSENCLNCHGPDEGKREADLRLDLEQAAKDSAIVPGDPDSSLFMQRIVSQNDDERMPPSSTGKSLSGRQIDLLRQWVEEGATYQGHWAFEPIPEPTTQWQTPGSVVVSGTATASASPSISQSGASRDSVATEIDRFILSKLEAQGLHLSPPVNRRQLIRRATFDLIGLPPAWDDVEAFVNDATSDAFEKVIDRLLDSPRYGERWGRHWLDIARYADTHGGSAIGFTRFPFSYTYRDYVINAWNADVPYDRFVTEQLAADQLGLRENDPALAGLGFLTVGMQFRNRNDRIDDQIDVVTRGLMGLTAACARCHDHKYDPIPTSDYYALYAALACSGPPDPLPMVGEPVQSEQYHLYQRQLTKLTTIRDDMARDQTQVMRSRLRMQVGLYLRELAKGTPEQDLSAAFLSYRTDDLRPLVLNRWRDYLAVMPEDDPVFGPWVQLAKLTAEDFQARFKMLMASWSEENGDRAQFASMQSLAKAAPKWNLRVLDALEAKQPASLLDLADAYGNLFAEVQGQWMTSLLNASLEAAEGAEILTDEDPRHEAINSAVNSQLRRHLHGEGTPTAIPDELAATLLNRTVSDSLGGKQGAIDNLQLSSPGSPPRAMALEEQGMEQTYHVFRRGNPLDRGEEVHPHFLTVLAGPNLSPATFPDGQRRLALARAIVDPNNPLLRRVIVNWVWQQHFGQGLVRTADDFGTRSQPPSHPELLDFLAVSLLQDGWSLKRLHKRIMLSDVYQQAAIEDAAARESDPDNQLLWRMPRRRLEMEAMRDAMLSVSGELDVSSLGGRPFDFLSSSIVPRRSVYGFVNRDVISSLASTFDVANSATCTAKRPETTVPQQTLFALNSDFIQDRAVAFALLTQQIESRPQRVIDMYQRALGRSPQAEEIQTALDYVTGSLNGDEGEDRWQHLAHVLLAANEFVFID